MWNNKEAHFDGDYFFKDVAFGTDVAVSQEFNAGNTEAGIRVRGWIEGSATCASGNTVTAKLQVSNDKTNWEDYEEMVTVADSTTLDGEFLAVIPDTDKKFMRVSVANTGATGNFSVALEYIPR